VGLLAEEAARLNENYIHFMRHARPFVHLKLASSLDGRIATRTGDSRWITGERARARSHELRHEYDAILVGSGTVLADNPLLTDRSGKPRRLPLTRVLLDPRLRLSPDSQLAQTARDAPVLLFTSESAEASAVEALERCGIEVLRFGDGRNLDAVLTTLGHRSIQSVLVEGGAKVAGALLDAQLVDKVSFFIAPLIIGGCDAPSAVGGAGAQKIADAMRLHEVKLKQHGPDIEVTGYPSRDEG
jgi:diaminohydroxyphosphoribosylaminopyrimidine deaminase/5-amino-6-(5-phosphoribosylamino)uracil reductase